MVTVSLPFAGDALSLDLIRRQPFKWGTAIELDFLGLGVLLCSSEATLLRKPAMGFTLPLSRVEKRALPAIGQKVSSKVPLRNVEEYSYLISLSIGKQDFQAIFDTGSSDLWVVSSACTDTDCQQIHKYNPTSTLSLADVPFNLTYLTGRVSGEIGYETVAFGPYMIFSQVLALADGTQNMGLSAMGVSGVLGLSFPSEAAIPMKTGRTLLENLFSSIDPGSRFFTYKLSSDASSSSFSVGEIDPRYSRRAIDYSPVFLSEGRDFDYWKLPLLSLSINSAAAPFTLSRSKVHGSASPIAVLDTGTTLILGPTHDVDNFWTLVGGTRKNANGTWQVRCNHAVTVGFLLGNDTSRKGIVLDPSDISWTPSGIPPDDGWCLGGIQSNDGVFSADWLLGDIFLRNAYIIHTEATESSAPLIGLLGTTNITQSYAQFQTSRGDDSILVASHAALPFRGPNKLPPGPIFAVTSVLSFIVGTSLGILFRSRRMKNSETAIITAKRTQRQWKMK